MEVRTIAIANNKTQRRYTIQTAAETLGQLKEQLASQGIDYAGMTFTEGISKTQLLTDDSLLPTNVMYKGQPTNNLVMLLTNPSKQIASGVVDRKVAYALVKELGIQNEINAKEGVNWTRCKTDVLEKYILDAENQGPTAEEAFCEGPVKKDVKTSKHPDLVELIYLGVKYLAKTHRLYADDLAVISDLTEELYGRMKESEPVISDEDIDSMMASLY